MPENMPDHEMLERVLKTEPDKVLARLPDNTEARSAKRHLEMAYVYAKEAREKIKPS